MKNNETVYLVSFPSGEKKIFGCLAAITDYYPVHRIGCTIHDLYKFRFSETNKVYENELCAIYLKNVHRKLQKNRNFAKT